MTLRLAWRPCAPPTQQFGIDLRRVLGHRLWDGIGDRATEWQVVDAALVPYLEGVAAGASAESDLRKDADKLIEIIVEHGAIELRIQ